ncbi:hypothetical protein [Bradyrhizobium sp. B120]|uniref:hypothetical protein n=1 Tax=Bradyrhizobium sp. B120 TaxID=3410088 RepID=UPI003B9819D2
MNVGSIKYHLHVFDMEHQPQSAFASGPNRCADLLLTEMLRAQICFSHHQPSLTVLMEAREAHSACDRQARKIQRPLRVGPVTCLPS